MTSFVLWLANLNIKRNVTTLYLTFTYCGTLYELANDQFPEGNLIVQMVEQVQRNRVVMGSNPLQDWIFMSFFAATQVVLYFSL